MGGQAACRLVFLPGLGYNAQRLQQGGTQPKQEAKANGFRDQEAAQGHEQAQAQEAPEEGPFQQVSALSQGGTPKTAS